MGIAKAQKVKPLKVCKCGCNETFYPMPAYKTGTPGLTVPEYKKGHHPNSKKAIKDTPAWNKGMTKDDHPSIAKMGFQPGHNPYTDWSHVNHALQTNEELRAKWLKAKQGQVPWNKGIDKTQYPNGTTSGPKHGNWCGNKRGPKDLAEMKCLVRATLKRDNYTCQHCGDHNYKGRGSRCKLEVHHIIAIAEDVSLAFDPNNLITLCNLCHRKTDNYGTKVVTKLKKQGGKK